MLGMRIKFIDSDPNTGKVDLKAMKKAITSNTALLVGSAPNYPHGIIDDIEAIAQVFNESINYSEKWHKFDLFFS